jgi:hypothetical protein
MKSNKIYIRAFTILFALIAPLASARQVASRNLSDEDALKIAQSFKPFLQCAFDDELKITRTDRWPRGETFRPIATSTGQQKVSVIDGYRAIFAYPETVFVNLKVEQSDNASYENDKKLVIDSLKFFTNAPQSATKINFRDNLNFNGFSGCGLDRDVIDVGNVMGTYVLFSDSDKKIITAYFLNQGKKKRYFNSVAEYQKLRDKFLQQYTSCVRANIASVAKSLPVKDGWNGLVIDESTPEDAIRLYGQPLEDKVDRLSIQIVDKWLTPKHKEKLFRKLKFKNIEKADKVELAFQDNKLVMISLGLGSLGENYPLESLTEKFGVNFIAMKEATNRAEQLIAGEGEFKVVYKLPEQASPIDYETHVGTREVPPYDYGYEMIAVSRKSFYWARIMSFNTASGKVRDLEIISRKLER